MESIMRIQNVSKTIGRKKIIDNISFELRQGEVFGFLGPNGAGKTTTIKMIMGFFSVDEGDIIIDGFDHRKKYESAMAALGGIVENPEMYQDLSGRVNLEMYARLHDGVTPGRIDEVVRLVGMEDRINDKIKRYSLGMKQRVGLAQALLHRPKILILDEPTNGLDPAGIRELRDILKKLAHEENVAVMVSSHLLSEMQMMCDRVAIINNGRILKVLLMDEISNQGNRTPSYFLTVSDPAGATKITASVEGAEIVRTDEVGFEVRAAEDILQKIIFDLLSKKIVITGISQMKVSLEDAFLEITGGGMHIA